jgi:DNA-binding XRE family transcriptional regulator
MYQDFLIDLKTARRRSGLTQADCGHLLGGSKSKISNLETGRKLPSMKEICGLSLIYRAFALEVDRGI